MSGQLTADQPVEVHCDFGHVVGKVWCKGYLFQQYEAFDERVRVVFMRDEPTCLVRVVGGFCDGCVVRYRVSEVRAV